MILTMLRKKKFGKRLKVVHSWNTSSYHIWNHISLCVETNSFSILLYFSSVKRLYLSQKNHMYIINQNMWFLNHCTSEDHDIPSISPYGTHLVQVNLSLTVLLLVNKSLTMALKSNISHWSLYIYYSKFAKDHFFLIKYFCILKKFHKYFCVS